MLTSKHEKMLVNHLDLLRDLEAVTIYIQDKDITLKDVRSIFDRTLSKYPTTLPLKEYLSSDAAIVADPEFESAVVRILDGK